MFPPKTEYDLIQYYENKERALQLQEQKARNERIKQEQDRIWAEKKKALQIQELRSQADSLIYKRLKSHLSCKISDIIEDCGNFIIWGPSVIAIIVLVYKHGIKYLFNSEMASILECLLLGPYIMDYYFHDSRLKVREVKR